MILSAAKRPTGHTKARTAMPSPFGDLSLFYRPDEDRTLTATRWSKPSQGSEMSATMEPLRAEHRHLLPHIEELRLAAEAVGTAPPEQVVALVDGCVTFLDAHLIPHAEAEEAALYPVVQKVMGAPQATATMSRDHQEVGRLAAELQDLRAKLAARGADGGLAADLRRVLYGLYTLVKVHFAKEEEVYLPLLAEHLRPHEAQAMFTAMHEAVTAHHAGK
jgi:iron-sulfur cluster repair protein YtfE (RIC family)